MARPLRKYPGFYKFQKIYKLQHESILIKLIIMRPKSWPCSSWALFIVFAALFTYPLCGQSNFIGTWEGTTKCTNPEAIASSFKFDIWSDNGILKCSDHSSSNQFKPLQLTNDGKLVCHWFRSNSDAHGTYTFYFKENNQNTILGYEYAVGVPCKHYEYLLHRKISKQNFSDYVGTWKGSTWCSDPPKSSSSFTFDIWIENGIVKCSDHSSSNLFRPLSFTKDGKLICQWFRNNSDANGTYFFYLDPKNRNILLGYENTAGISCKRYQYKLARSN